MHGETGTGAIRLRKARRGVRAAGPYAAHELARRVVSAPSELTLPALGPLTNVALAMRLEPRFVEHVARIIWMSGIVRGPGNVGPFATANVLSDAEAAAVVFAESGGKLTMVGQDVTRHVRILDDRFERIGGYGEIGRYVHNIAGFYRDAYGKLEPHLDGFPVHDLLVMAYALRPRLFSTEQLPVRVETEGELTVGMTVADFRSNTRSPADITVCTKANGPAILDWYEKVLKTVG